ncbi:MAG: LacI family DNA-binding transcriptional regulator [Christensenellaceae bacterium]|nr:LacI family DNA-binding transcriptional regulator [Christensenellaceae bacterium]
MAVIKDVANLAGVSVSTVSKYFNNPAGLSEPYKSKVEKAVKELNFTPNAMARGLRTKRTNTIALIVPDITNNFYVEVYNSIRSAALAQGLITQLYTCEENVNVLSDLLSQLSPVKVDGIIMAFLDEDEIMTQLSEAQTNLPITLMSWDIDNQFSAVVLNLHSTIYRSTKYLIEQGHKRIAYISGIKNSRISQEKLSGYLKAMSDSGFDIPENYISHGKYLFRTGYQAAKGFMMLPEPPTAVVAANDILAIGCCKYLISHGYHIPEDVAVIGMDGVQLSHIYDPSITTMAIPIEEMCLDAVGMLINKIEKPGSKNRQTIYETNLVIGRSTYPSAPLHLDL